jgi:hypothetical protein
VGLLESSDREKITASMELIRELEFDVLVPWAATAGDPWWAITDRADTRQRIDKALVAAGLQDSAPGVVRVSA